MIELKQFVEELFAKHPKTKEVQELKSEVLSNLEAKVSDYLAEGMSYENALSRATKDFDTVDLLIEGNKAVYINQYRWNLLQTSLIYVLIFWIISLPLRIVSIGMWLNSLFTLVVLLSVILYVIMIWFRKDQFLNAVQVVNTNKLKKRSQIAWLLWGLYVLAMTLSTTALQFGSNIWFQRPVHIDGPYQFALIAIKYVYPILTVIIPIIIHQAFKLVYKHEGEEQ